MLGPLISSLDDPQVSAALVAALNDPGLLARMATVGDEAGQSQAQLVASAVRSFLDTASDDLWTQLIDIVNRAEDPGLAAMRAILTKAFPPLREVKP